MSCDDLVRRGECVIRGACGDGTELLLCPDLGALLPHLPHSGTRCTPFRPRVLVHLASYAALYFLAIELELRYDPLAYDPITATLLDPPLTPLPAELLVLLPSGGAWGGSDYLHQQSGWRDMQGSTHATPRLQGSFAPRQAGRQGVRICICTGLLSAAPSLVWLRGPAFSRA